MAIDQYPYVPDESEPVSRRTLLKQGTAAVLGGGASMLGAPLAQAQAPPAQQAPAMFAGWRPQTAGQKFRALVRYRTNLDVQELTLTPIQPRQIVARVEAAQACYTMLTNAMGNLQNAPANAFVFGHGAVATVIEAGPMVKRVQPGDRVLVAVTGQCGQCYQCLRGKAANCQAGVGRTNTVVGTMSDGTPVTGQLGGFAELIVAWEELVVPIRSQHDAAELSNLTCVSMTGLGMTMKRTPVEAGSSVVVFGAGPIGLSAVQGARIQGASQIIAVEPIAYRRELAQKVGATAVLDPNEFENAAALIARLRQMTDWAPAGAFSGGRAGNSIGPDFLIEAVGGERFTPKTERYAREPHGLEVLQNVFTLCPPGGVMRTCGVGYPAGSTVSFPAGGWSNGTKTHLGGNLAGAQGMRDLPQWTRLFETGQFNGAALVGVKVPLDRWREALEAAAYRTAITGIVTFT